MISLVGDLLVSGLKLWTLREQGKQKREATKYLREAIKLRETIINEMDQPRYHRDQSLVDRSERRLLFLSKEFIRFTSGFTSETDRPDSLS